MPGLIELQKDIAASLWIKPGPFEELRQRDFLKNKNDYGIDVMLRSMEKKGWIYQRGEIYHTKGACFKQVLNPAGYELNVKTDGRSPLEKEFQKLMKKFTS